MKTLSILFALLILQTACSKDDGNKEEQGNLYPTHIISDFFDYINIQYNDDKTVQQIDVAGDIVINFQYASSQINAVVFIFGGNNAFSYAFSYNQAGKINSMTDNEMNVFPVTYNEAENSYSYTNNNDDEIRIDLTEFGDVSLLTEIQNNGNLYDYEYYFNNENQGPLSNSNAVAAHILLAMPDPLIAFIVHALSKQPIDRYMDDNDVFNFENTFNEDGLLISRDYFNFNDDPVTDVFEYTEL